MAGWRDRSDDFPDDLVMPIAPLGVGRRAGILFRASGWQPTVDVLVTGDRVWVRMEVAGVAESDLEVRLRGNVVEVRGTRRPPEDLSGKGFYRAEIFYGAFERRITLPWRARPVDEGACVRYGILDLWLQRCDGGEPADVPVRGGGRA